MDDSAAVDPGSACDAGEEVGSAVFADLSFDPGGEWDDDAGCDVAGVLEVCLCELEVAVECLVFCESGEVFDALASECFLLSFASLMHAWHCQGLRGKGVVVMGKKGKKRERRRGRIISCAGMVVPFSC
jgi:hypothetical protein